MEQEEEQAPAPEPPARTILYARGAERQRRPLPVPSWFDLPVLLPEPHAVARRIQRGLVKPQAEATAVLNGTPKVSRLAREQSKERQMSVVRRKRSRVRRLDALDSRSWLREKLKRDLDRFGLWPMAGQTDPQVESAVDSIWNQWQRASEPSSADSSEGSFDSTGVDSTESRGSVFLTDGVPVSMATTPEVDTEVEVRRASVLTEAERPEEDNEEEEEEQMAASFFGSHRMMQPNVQTPGLKRRKRLTDLHRFVGTQLKKRLFRNWDTIEIAFSGSGDMTVSQIVKFLQHSDVQLGEKDAAKVQSILEEHAAAMHAAREAEDVGDGVVNSPSNQKRGKRQSALMSFEGFRQIFHPVDPQEASRWKREFDRDKFRQRQEKEIYSKELAALEEKVRQRLASSAKQMIEILQQFKCDPSEVPWGNEEQRLHLRAQFLEVIFRKPNRRRVLQHPNGNPSSAIIDSPGGQVALSSVPEKLSIKLFLSMLLQKYSRNGHFESIEVPAAAYLYHDFATDIVKQSIRRFWEKEEIDQWPERQMIFRFRIKKQTFYDWRKFAERSRMLRQYVLRKFVAWKYMTRKLHEHYAFYRTSFWPFYVWKRHLQQMIIARGKTTFLMNVWRTYVQLRHFRALKQRYKKKKWNQKQIARARKKKARKVCIICWDSWKDKYQRLRLIHQAWRDHGHLLQKLHKYYMVRVTFYVLRYYSILKKDMKRRKYKSLLSQFSVHSKARSQSPQHHRPKQAVGTSYRSASRNSSLTSLDGQSNGRALSVEQHTRGVALLITGEDGPAQSENTDTGATASLTRIMETEMGKKIKRKSRLYDLCLGLYLKYREQDRSNMIGNVVAYRRLGRIFLQDLKCAVIHNKKNRFVTDLGAFRVLQSRFRQWMIGAVYKDPPVARHDSVEITKKDDEAEDNGDKVVLHWRHDREWRLQGIVENPLRAQKLRAALLSIMENDSVRKETIRGRELLLNKKQASEDAFLRKETGATLKIKAAQMQQVQQIMRRRAHRLHDAMDNVYDVLLQQQARQQLRSSFRSLRIAVMLKHARLLCHRAQIRNWLRICYRFMYWEKNMDLFYKRKLKYHAFQTLLKHAVWKWKLQSPGLSDKLQRSQQLMWKYEHFLRHQGLFADTSESLHLAGTKFSPANTFHGVFLRWVQFTQTAKARTMLIELTRRKMDIWLVNTVFQALKNRVKTQYTYLQRCANLPYLWRQSMVDLDTYQCKIVALEKRLPSTALKVKLRHSRRLMQQAAMSSPTLKKLFQDHEKEVRQRLQLEKRLMLVAYNERAVHNYAERGSALFGTSAGRPFMYEKAPPFSSISEVAVICSKKVDGISLTLKANTSATIEGTLHGNPFGTREVFSLARGEKLTIVEGFASQSIYGLRFGTSTGRFSKWFGHCEKGTKFEISSDYYGKREEIVGIYGHADSASINSLGVIMRHTTLKNPFEGLWVHRDHHPQQGLMPQREELPLSDRQFAYFLQVRACEVIIAMQRAHQFATRAYRMEASLPPALGSMRVIMAIARWMLNALSHGLVHCTDREEEGKAILQSGLEKRTTGEKLLADGIATMRIVDGFRDADGQLDAATLGVKKIVELREMLAQGQQQISEGEQLMEEGRNEIVLSQHILPHLPTTKRMVSAIRKMYKVVQTKDEIDQMTPELRSILLLKRNANAIERLMM